ncbi:MAG: DegT/DnrJ/EryC1/StrS family aminotransferase [Syntrophorhabdaceae bacterium]|nr:DegT/DnrJ/EryC1/StrS family aminotransferase [Syntrophorhabdaceae bacterium]
MNVKIFDIERDHSPIKTDLLKTFEKVLSSGEYILGKEVRALEEEFAAYVGVKYAAGVASGTDAIKIGGLALGIRAGDKFVTTPNTYIATAMALSEHGLIPRFCDIEEDSCNMDPSALEKLLKNEKDVRLCVPVHLYGQPCPLDEIRDVCARYGVMIMEDACQAHGSRYKDRNVGTVGDVSAFSFYPTKNLGCYGDGGIIVTDNEDVYRKTLALRAHGQSDRHVHDIQGFVSRLDELQAALLRVKLPFLDEWNIRRRRNASLYDGGLEGLPVKRPVEAPYSYHVYHLYVIAVEDRDALRTYLGEKGIVTLVHYPTPIHLQKVYGHLGYGPDSFPKAEKAARQIISLPLYPSLREDEIAYVCRTISEFYGK